MSVFDREFVSHKKPSKNKGLNRRNGGKQQLPARLTYMAKIKQSENPNNEKA